MMLYNLFWHLFCPCVSALLHIKEGKVEWLGNNIFSTILLLQIMKYFPNIDFSNMLKMYLILTVLSVQ